MKINNNFYHFIESNLHKDPFGLRLSVRKEDFDFDTDFALTQIECRAKYSLKLKNFLSNPLFLFPDGISGEQSSHQAVALYHSSLFPANSKILDMTAGLGIDALIFAMTGHDVTAIELDQKKAEVLEYNALQLKLKNIKIINTDSITFLEKTRETYDVIFIDPARRNNQNKRIYNLHDCQPDILKYQNLALSHAERVFIKASPLLDITQTIKDFDDIATIRAIGVKGECKEVLIELQRDCNRNKKQIIVEAINLDNEGRILSSFSDLYANTQDDIPIAEEEDLKPGTFMMEPSAMMMKLQPWEIICKKFNTKKLGKSSHIFISETKPNNFPGRVTRLEKILIKKDRKALINFPATVISRNYPMTSEEIRNNFKLKEGDNFFIYATRLGNKPIMFLSKSETCSQN